MKQFDKFKVQYSVCLYYKRPQMISCKIYVFGGLHLAPGILQLAELQVIPRVAVHNIYLIVPYSSCYSCPDATLDGLHDLLFLLLFTSYGYNHLCCKRTEPHRDIEIHYSVIGGLQSWRLLTSNCGVLLDPWRSLLKFWKDEYPTPAQNNVFQKDCTICFFLDTVQID